MSDETITSLKLRDGDQPLPVGGRECVQDRLIEEIEKRKQLGISRYGSALMTHNQRDAVRDAWEEAIDLAAYLTQVVMEREPRPEFAAIEAPLIAQGERDAALLRERLATDETIARGAAQTRSGRPGGHWKVDCDCPVPCADDCDAERVEGDNITIYSEGGHDNWQAQHVARHDPARVLDQCASIGDALTDLERITDRSPDPDSRAWVRAAINSLRRIWEPDENALNPDDVRVDRYSNIAMTAWRVTHLPTGLVAQGDTRHEAWGQLTVLVAEHRGAEGGDTP